MDERPPTCAPSGTWLTTAEAAFVLLVSQVRVSTLARKGRLPAVRQGRQWLVDRAAVEKRAAERVAAQPPPRGYLYRMTLTATGETALTDIFRFGALRYLYAPGQADGLHRLVPGDRVAFPEDDLGPAWTVECLPEAQTDTRLTWRRLAGTCSLTLDPKSDGLAANDRGT